MALDLSASSTVTATAAAALESRFEAKTPEDVLTAAIAKAVPELADRIYPVLTDKTHDCAVYRMLSPQLEGQQTLRGTMAWRFLFEVAITSANYNSMTRLWRQAFESLGLVRGLTISDPGADEFNIDGMYYMRAMIVEVDV